MFETFDDLFAPGRKHTRDERNRLALTREETGDNDPGRGPIDLTSGKALVRLPAPKPPGPASAGPGPTRLEPTALEPAAPEAAGPEAAEPSA
ncbi:DUF6191 domain-containing protein [Streptomyces sp. NPDC028722]|uniref:DUF6191 domain-containing protein n=1 Tax=Streptomyces sp. NPDC028722 TaxID=3155016 RepID=UPI0033C234C7